MTTPAAAKPPNNPDIWRDHVVVATHALLDDHGVPDKDENDQNLGLLARVTWVVEQMQHLTRQLEGDQCNPTT